MVGRLLANAWLIAFCGLVLLLALLLPIPALGAPDPPDHSCLTDDSMDDDGDGILDADDPAPCQAGAVPTPADTTNSLDHDSNGDGLTNDADPDDENDGFEDADDPEPFNPAFPGNVTPTPATDSEGVDSDGDGLPNAADPDDDNDGVQDADDAAPFDPNVSVLPTPTPQPRRSAAAAGAAASTDTGPPLLRPEPVLVRDLLLPAPMVAPAAPREVAREAEEPVTTLPTTGQRQAVETGIAGPLALILLALTCVAAGRALGREHT